MSTHTSILARFIVLLAVSSAGAGEIYTWIDANGITHFSETAPEDPATGAAQVRLPPAPASGAAPPGDYYSVINQAARMEARRLEREKLRAERLQAEAEARKARAEEQAALEAARQAASQEEPRYFPLYLHAPRAGYWPYPRHRPRHHDRPYPDHRTGTRSIPRGTAPDRSVPRR